MLSVRAVYDGNALKFRDSIKINYPRDVIVTFLDESDDDISTQTIHEFAMNGGAFAFLENIEEDIYSDEDLKVKF